MVFSALVGSVGGVAASTSGHDVRSCGAVVGVGYCCGGVAASTAWLHEPRCRLIVPAALFSA